MKAVIVFLILASLGLGVGLMMRHKQAVEIVKQKDDKIEMLSKNVSDTKNKLDEQEKLAMYLQTEGCQNQKYNCCLHRNRRMRVRQSNGKRDICILLNRRARLNLIHGIAEHGSGDDPAECHALSAGVAATLYF